MKTICKECINLKREDLRIIDNGIYGIKYHCKTYGAPEEMRFLKSKNKLPEIRYCPVFSTGIIARLRNRWWFR